jgi:signal peptidase II
VTKKRTPKRPKPPAPKPRTPKAIAIAIAVTVALLAADLWTKAWAENELSTERMGRLPPLCETDEYGTLATQRQRTEPIVLIDEYLMFRYAENCGAAFGLMRDAPPVARKVVFGLAAAAASLVMFVLFARGRGQTLFAVSVPLIVSGAVGNLIDRVRYGYVVDFIRFHLPNGWEWPTFNIADCGITVGVILLVLDGFKEGRREKREKSEKEAQSSEKASGAGA